jgi:hypothetical protein
VGIYALCWVLIVAVLNQFAMKEYMVRIWGKSGGCGCLVPAGKSQLDTDAQA